MQLDDIKLHNYKIHRDLKLTLGPGVTGILGDNGSGKSSVISAIRFLYTGEVDTESKKDSITLGETEGWVTGSFTLNGKKGSLERHLATSKVVLKYDDQVYIKSAEVKNLWDKLLQIDGSIFNNVIVAGQGEIPLLFSGDQMMREKIFQKIFLVPPTERLRAIIWDHYIKPCAPEKFEEDVTALQSQEADIATRRNKILAQIDAYQLSILSDVHLKCFMERISYLEKCISDTKLRPELETNIAVLEGEIDAARADVTGFENWLSLVDIEAMKASYEQLLAQKNLAAHKEELENEIELFRARAPSEEDILAKREEVTKIEEEEAKAKQALDEANAAASYDRNRYDQFAQLEGHEQCPTCNQSVTDIVNILAALKQEAEESQRCVVTRNATYTVINKRAARLRSDKSLLEGQYQRMQNLEQQLARYSDVTYSEEDFKTLAAALQNIHSTQHALQERYQHMTRTEGELGIAHEKLKNLATYDGTDSVEAELTTMREVIQENKHRAEELENLRVDQAKLEHELQLLETRIDTSLENKKYNDQRREYLAKMESAYSILHISKFPRKLIQNYAEHVEVYLSQFLEMFNMPYRAKIAEGFKIQMLDAEGRKLPDVSGGQEMIIGICLRLALHKMFAQSFPLWIVDEGTTHLSAAKRKAYFQLIEDIRTQKIVNQVLIIDHDNQLSSVVDRTIQL